MRSLSASQTYKMIGQLSQSRSFGKCLLLLLVLIGCQRLLIGFWPIDDAFITFRFAHNLAVHGQPVYNLNDPVFGSTALLYMFLLALASLIMPIPAASWVLTLLGDAGVCALLLLLSGRIYRSFGRGMLAGALYLMHPVIALNASGGMETSIFLTVLLTIALAVGSRRFDLALIATALLPWIRIDGVVAVPVIAAMWWRAGRPAIRWGAIGTAAAIVVAYAVFTSLVYDTLIPQSALSKLGESYGRPVEAMTVAVSFMAAVAGLSSTFYWYLTPQVLLLIGLAWKLASRRVHPAEQTLLLIAFLHAFAYIIPGRAYAINFPWYFVPFVALTILPSVDALIEVGRRFRFKPLPRVGLLVLCAGLLACVVAAFGLRYVDGFLESTMNVLPSAKRVLQEPRRLDSVRQILFGNLLLAGGILIALIAGTEAIRRARSGAFQAGLGFFLATLMIAPIYLSRKHVIEKYERREASYLALGQWVSDHIAPEELIGATEIGAFGWGAIDNTVYDEWGLVTKGAKGAEQDEVGSGTSARRSARFEYDRREEEGAGADPELRRHNDGLQSILFEEGSTARLGGGSGEIGVT